jgi:hypothetical protein
MKDVLSSILAFLQSSGLLAGRLRDPVDVIRLGIKISYPGKRHRFENVVAGVSIGAHPRECQETVPDMLLGIIRWDTGAWEWAGDHPGHIVNLHADVTLKHTEGWPVWLTFAHCPGAREDLVKSNTKEFDVYETILEQRRKKFWDSAYQEFIQTTWHPSRLAWCMDTDEHREIFSARISNGLSL